MTWFDGLDGSIYPEQFVVHNDGDEYQLVARRPGPAGAVETELADGVVVQVDFVEVGRAVTVTVEGSGVPPTVGRLIGGSRQASLEQHLESGTRSAARLHGGVQMNSPSQNLSLDQFPPSRDAQEIGAVAVLRSIGDDDRFDDLTRAVALVESVEHVGRLDALAGPEDESRSALDAAAELLHGLDDDLRMLADEDRFLALELSKMLSVLAGPRLTIVRASRLLERQAGDLSRDVDVAVAFASAPPRVEAEFSESTIAAPPPEPSVELSDGGLLTVRPGWPVGGGWLRVVHRGPMVLLALVPILEEDGKPIARAVLGSGYSLGDLQLEITDDPLPEPTAKFDRIARAVSFGRRATVVEATDRVAAVDLWRKCAEAWDALGDARRAREARVYARGRRRPGRVPFLTERVYAVVARDPV